MPEYKIGQILTTNKDIEAEKALSGERVTIKKGNRVIIGADNWAHHLRNGVIQPLGDVTVKGYDTTGLAEYLVMVLKASFPIDEMLEDYNIKEEELQDEIEYALDDIGL